MTDVINQNASLIFDLDGTLIDSAKDIQWVANKALSEIGATPLVMRKPLVLLVRVHLSLLKK